MIKKLRFKVIGFAMLAVFALLTVILSAVNVINFSMVATNADTILDVIVENGGEFAEPTPPDDSQGTSSESSSTSSVTSSEDSEESESSETSEASEDWDGSEETSSGATAETLAVPGDQGGPGGGGGQEGPGQMGPSSPETAASTRYFTVSIDPDTGSTAIVAFHISAITQETAMEWANDLANSTKGWTHTTYRYRTYTHNEYTYVTVMDQGRELDPSYRVLWISLAGSGVGLVISFFVLIPLSKWMVKPLEVSTKKQQRFISDASHELKTPLTIISLNNDLEEAERGPSENTQNITKQVALLTELVRDLNTLARMDEGEKPAFEKFDVTEVAKEVSKGFLSPAEAKTIKLELKIEEGLTYVGSQDQIKNLMGIIMDNALKYATSEISFSVYQKGDRLVIKESNDAANLPEDDGPLDSVFERFYRLDESRSSDIPGSGIGLSIAKEIVNNHKGRIYAKSEKGKFIIKAEL